MTKRRGWRLTMAAVGLAALGLAPRAHAAVPEGWIAAGSHPQDYEMAVDRGMSAPSQKAPPAVIRAKTAEAQGFGTLMQMFKADRYRGKRVRLSAQAASENVADWAGLWMRIDPKGGGRPTAFDNMQSRPIKGSTRWTRHEVVLDVAPDAEAIAFGVLLAGKGAVWVTSVRLEEVPRSVPTTGDFGLDDGPRNLELQ